MSEYNKTNYETIKPFEPTNEIEQGYLDDILSVFENEIKVTGIKEYQSPYSTSKTVLIEYVSHPDFNWREDAVFNLLHDKDILDTSIDYTPITPDKSGTINDYLKRLQKQSHEVSQSGFSTIQSQEQLNKAVSFVTQKQKKENFMGINEQSQNPNVKNKEEIWTWIHYSDGSGNVRSPNGKEYFEYDWATKEYRVTPASRWEFYIDVYDPSDKNKTFDDFKKFAEQEIKIKIAKAPNVLFESRHIREEEYIEEPPIHDHERTKIPKQTIQEGERNMEQTEKKTPYYQQQIEKLHEAVKTGTAPFFLKEAVVGENNEVKNPGNYIEDNDKIILTPRPAVRTVKGNLLKGVNQLSAQIELDNMGSKAQTVLSFEDAKAAGTYIKKGSKSILLTGYDKDNERSKVYHVFSAGSVANKDVIKEQLYKNNELNKEKPWSKAIVCTDSNPEKYLGAYLAASASGSVLETDRKTVETFQKNFQNLIEKSISEKKHTAVFDVVRSAQMVKSEILKKNYNTWEKSQEQHKQGQQKGQQKKSPQSDMEMVF